MADPHQVDLLALLDEAPAHVAVFDEDGRIVWVNRAAAATEGKPADQIVGRTVGELGYTVERDDPPADGGSRFLPYTVQLSRDGRSRWETGIRFALPQGIPLGPGLVSQTGSTCFVAYEITAQVLAERERRTAEARFAAFMARVPAAAAIKDRLGSTIWANQAYLEAYGSGDERFVGAEPALFTPAADGGRGVPADDEVAAEAGPRTDVLLRRRADGSETAVLGQRFPLPVPGGGTALGGLFTDITQEREARLRAVAAEAGYRQLFEHAGVPIVVFDLAGHVADANAAYTSMIGHPLLSLRGMFIRDLVTTPTAVKDADRWRRLTAGEISSYRSRAAVRHAAGHVIPTVATMSLVRRADGAPEAVYGVTDPVLAVDGAAASADAPPLPDERLNTVERAILVTLAAGGTLREAERELHLSRQGLNHHLGKLRRRLRLPPATRTAGVVARAYALGLLVPGTWPPRAAGDFPG